jgi:thioredoxin reductase (NADPH)
VYDIAIIGGGPAGLTAAIKAGTEGLSAVVLEKSSTLGGRPFMSPLIENVPGWPAGIEGPTFGALLATQARKFGSELRTNAAVTGVMRLTDQIAVMLAPSFTGVCTQGGEQGGDATVYARSVIIAVGEVTPKIDALRPFEGRGVEYACDATALHEHAGQHVLLVGGGNASAQLALALAERGVGRVTILTRSEMSQITSMYLRQRLAQVRDKVAVVMGEVTTAHGDERLSRVSVAVEKGKIGLRPDHTYVFISGVPPTGWFPGAKTRDGYIITGRDVLLEDEWQRLKGEPRVWPLEREPYPQESSVPGVFVAGDVRYGATGGITVAFGEGTQAFQWIKREYLPGLAELPTREEIAA